MSTENSNEMHQYLTFELDQEIFSLPIASVREVLDFTEVTKVPRTPEFMRGVINLRGNVVPVVDLRQKFDLGATEKTVNTCIIIVELDIEGDRAVLGALADSVREVLELTPEQIMPPPKMGTRLNTEFIRGMGKQDEDTFIIILDIDRVFSGEELALVQQGERGKAGTTESIQA